MSIGWKLSNIARRISKRHVLGGMIVVAVALSFLGPGVSGAFRNTIQPILAPPADAGMYATIWVKERADRATMTPVTPADYHELQQRYEQQLQINQKLLDKIRAQAERLQYPMPLYGKSNAMFFPRDLISARVLASDSLPYGKTAMVNSGTNSGVEPGCPATTRILLTDRSKAIPISDDANLSAVELHKISPITYQLLVGEIIEAWAYGARLRLVTDRGFKRSGSIRRIVNPQKPRKYTIIEKDNAVEMTLTADSPLVDVHVNGDGSEGLIATNVPINHAIQPGDIVTTRDNNIFMPALIKIGAVTRVKQLASNPGFVTVYISPSANLATLRNIYIVVNQKYPGGP